MRCLLMLLSVAFPVLASPAESLEDALMAARRAQANRTANIESLQISWTGAYIQVTEKEMLLRMKSRGL